MYAGKCLKRSITIGVVRVCIALEPPLHTPANVLSVGLTRPVRNLAVGWLRILPRAGENMRKCLGNEDDWRKGKWEPVDGYIIAAGGRRAQGLWPSRAPEDVRVGFMRARGRAGRV